MTDEKESPTGQGEANNQANSNSYRKKSNKKQNDNQGQNNREPWPDAVDGASLLDEIREALIRHLSLPDGAAEAIALWILFTHSFDAAEVSPRLALTSPAPGCGKTTALTLLAHLVRRPLPASNWTAATVFRSIEPDCPTLIIDEADTFLENSTDLRGILNSGHTPGMAFVMRAVGEDHLPKRFSTWAPMAMAKIGPFPTTLEERSILILMRKRKSSERVKKVRSAHHKVFNDLARKSARWANDNLDDLHDTDPDSPPDLSDRAADNWQPLFAIADAAGGHWPKTARDTALLLSTGSGEFVEAVDLLEQCQKALVAQQGAKISSKSLADKLKRTPRTIASTLRQFGIRPKTIRIGTQTVRGYIQAEFEDAFARYLAPPNATAQQDNDFNGLGEN